MKKKWFFRGICGCLTSDRAAAGRRLSGPRRPISVTILGRCPRPRTRREATGGDANAIPPVATVSCACPGVKGLSRHKRERGTTRIYSTVPLTPGQANACRFEVPRLGLRLSLHPDESAAAESRMNRFSFRQVASSESCSASVIRGQISGPASPSISCAMACATLCRASSSSS